MQFRLDELGAMEFERLCVALLGLELGGYEARPWGLSLLERDENGDATLVLVVWSRQGAAHVEYVIRDARAVHDERLAAVVVLTNVAGAAVYGADVLGPDELLARFVASPEARFRAPSALGVVDLDALIAPELVERSSGDLNAAADLARVFVPTASYEAALRVLARHHFAVLTGPPEMGKTAVARMIGLAALTAGWELHECTRADELWARLDRDRSQVFIADDAFGSTEYQPDAAEHWAVELDRILRAMDDRHWLIWTSRPAPFKAGLRRIHREHGVERFPQPVEVGVDAAALDLTERALILFRHARAACLPRPAVLTVQHFGYDIVSHEHFTPERIRRFVGGRLHGFAGVSDVDVGSAVAREIREPTEAMAASYRSLSPELRGILLALLDAPPGPVTERELVASVRRHCPDGLAEPLAATVDRLADQFVRVLEPAAVTWVHPSWRDLVIDELAADMEARRSFLHAAGVHGLLLALSTAGGAGGERSLPLLVGDGDWDAVADRLVELTPTLDEPDVTMLLRALDTAHDLAPAEIEALADELLTRLARRWDESLRAVPVGLLAAWFAAAAHLREPPSPPSVAVTWFDGMPTGPIDLIEDADALDDWTALAELLAIWQPEALDVLGFSRDRVQIEQRLLDAAFGAIVDRRELPTRAALVRALERLARLSDTPARFQKIANGLDRPRASTPEPPAPPLRELSPELEQLLAQPLLSGRDVRGFVARALRDL